MAFTKFKTDQRIWLALSLLLFVVPWFIPLSAEGKGMAPWVCWVILFTHPSHIGEALAAIGGFTLLFGIPAIVSGWVLQCITVMLRDARKRRVHNGA